MSYQRAYVNCMRCYELADRIATTLGKEKDVSENDQLYIARNEAMKALEQILASQVARHLPDGEDRSKEALKVCVNCDFSTPSIANVLYPIKSLESKKTSE
ncbi:hypothetical protein GOV03_00095 [Candidatus Woesearchaeota archaeon]|nr:hypothetical protein [Candidatus Woesearchaeota archaeon]